MRCSRGRNLPPIYRERMGGVIVNPENPKRILAVALVFVSIDAFTSVTASALDSRWNMRTHAPPIQRNTRHLMER